MKGAITLKPPVIFGITQKATPLDDTPTKAGIGWCLPSGKAALASPHDRHQEAGRD